jgi:hypothetical protein
MSHARVQYYEAEHPNDLFAVGRHEDSELMISSVHRLNLEDTRTLIRVQEPECGIMSLRTELSSLLPALGQKRR